jgi:hypothetical protein
MGKRIYVNGGILITTPFFAYKNAGAWHDTPPENSEIIEPNAITETGKFYLEISDEQPQSIFNEYYAKTFLRHNIHLLIFSKETLSDHIVILSKELMKSEV